MARRSRTRPMLWASMKTINATGHINTTSSYAPADGANQHTVTVTCGCGHEVSKETVDCTDDNSDGVCDLCQKNLVVLDPIEDMTGMLDDGETPKASIEVLTNNGNWKLGENKFSVKCDLACVVAYTEDGKAYERLTATAVEDEEGNVLYYEFTVTLTENTKIAVCLSGDVNNDGMTDATDAVLVLRYSSNLYEFNSLQECVANVDIDTVTDATDAVLILRSSSKLVDLIWSKA